MNNRIGIKLVGIFTILSILLAVLFIVRSDLREKNEKKPVFKDDFTIAVKDTFSSDLYYLKHPYLIKGDRLNDEEKYDSAIYYYNESSIKFEKEHQWDNYVWINGYIARLYLYVAGKNYEDALPYLQKALRRGNHNLRADHPYMAITYYYFGLYYHKQKVADKALGNLNNALEILLKTYKKDNIYTADVYDALGNVYAELMFDNIMAEKNFLKSIKIKEALPGEEKKSVLTSSYYNLVNLNFLMGDYEKAQTYCYQAIRNAAYVKKHAFYWLEFLEGVLANIYTEQQIFDKAIFRLENAIRINYEHNGDKGYLSYYNTLLGDINSRMKKFDSAMIFYKKALILGKTNSVYNDQKQQTATTSYSLGMTYLNLNNYKSALFYLSGCLNTRLNIYGNKSWETAIAFQGIGNVYEEAGLPDSALKYFQSALTASIKNFNDTTLYTVPLAAGINNNIYTYQIIRDKASMLKKLYYHDSSNVRFLSTSLAYYCLADTLMMLFRSSYDRESAKLIFSKHNNSIYEEAIDCTTLLYQKGSESRYLDLAFNFMDKRKSGLLLEALKEKEVLLQAGIPEKIQNLLGSLQQELVFLQSQLEKENSKENSEEAVLQVLHTRINSTREKFDSLHEGLVKDYPFYASTQQKNDSINLKDVQVYSERTNSVVLEYFWGDTAIYELVVYKHNIQLFKITRTSELDRYLEILQSALARGYVYTTKENDFISFIKSSNYVYNILIKPVLSSVNREVKGNNYKPNLVVIPDGALYYLPFEALVTTTAVEKEVDYKKLNYLVNSYVISYDYSARLLLKNFNRQNTSSKPEVLALSYSVDEASKSRLGKLDSLDKNAVAELPGSARELRAIASYMKGQFYMGDDATEQVFKKEASDFDILHLAVHGEADSLNSYHSKLILKKGNDSLNDGNLYAYEVYNLPIKAKLAVLSACESGKGKLNPGEGIFGMARGFLYAGCPSLVISYWRVNDNSTQLIVSDFYRQISKGDKIDQSLRKAKLEYIIKADRRTAHPANWAAFVAIGNMTPLVTESSLGTPIGFILMIGIITLLGISVYLNLFSKNYFKKTS